MFVDKVRITVIGGRGGDGAVAFHREKYVASGGPDGGDGGHGGSVVLRVSDHMTTLLDFRYKRKYTAQAGVNGLGRKMAGKRGEPLVIQVPRGTLIRDAESGKILHDMSDGEDFVLCRGGRGGWGNKHYATPTRQIPRFAKAGLPGDERNVLLELKMIADVGLAGLPSAGKSSLLAAVSAARPKIAEYHFTTLEPNLGVVSVGEGKGFVMADIPGLIEGASDGAGLGHDFLRHIERCRLIVQVIDISGVEGRDPVDDFHTISEELEKFSQALADKPRILVANKCDLLLEGEDSEEAKRLKTVADALGYPLYFISAATKMNLKVLIDAITQALTELPPVITFEAEAPLEEPETEEVTPEAVTVHRDDSGAFVCEGKWLQKLVERTNLDDRESLMYFQRMIQSCGIIDKLREAGCDEGHTVKMFGIEFDFVN